MPTEPGFDIGSLDNDDDINNFGPVEIPPPPQPVQSLDATGPRLMISKIVTENFKSYGGVRTIGPFHKNFSCVIGPNGSGKSNVIDSMLFVFGYRASKVRSKKLSQLIHQSELVPNVGSCMVAVHFQKIVDLGSGASDYEIVPNSSFIISRRAYKDNTSAYWIDDTRAVYRDVANLLRLHGIDLDHNRFLILQGEVEQIALMKPKAPSEHEDGFLEYLEDIIGSSRFKQPLATFTDRIEKLNDMRLEKLTRVKAVEKEKDELEGIRNEAMDYLRLVNQLVHMKNILYQQHLSKEQAVEAKTREQLNIARSELQTITSELNEKSRELSKTEADRDNLFERHAKLSKQHRDTKTKFSEFEAEDSRLRAEHSHYKSTGQRLTKSLQAERIKLEEMERLPEESESRKQTILRQLDELNETKKRHELAYQETVDSLAKETAPLRMKVEAAEASLAPIQAEADQLASTFTLEKQQFDLIMAGRRREQERADNARKAAENASLKLAERETELNQAKQSLMAPMSNRRNSSQTGSLTVGLASATRDLNEVKTKENELEKELNELRAKLAESKSTFQADNSKGRVLNALMESKRSGQLEGILGRLGDLCAIPPKYDVAISTACSALDHIVTDTMDTAQKAVVFLKQNNLGLATFIALDKMHTWAEKAKAPHSLPSGNFNVERLYDLVETVSSDIRPAVYFALRDTLVTDSMDSAVKIAFDQRRRHRVVTLQGQLIETSGAMSGGGGRPLSGRMFTSLAQARERKQIFDGSHSSSGRNRKSSTGKDETSDFTNLEKQLSKGDADLTRLRENRSRLEELVARLSRQRDEAERTVKRCENECSRLRAEVAALTTEADQAQQRANSMGPSETEQRRLCANLDKLEKTAKAKGDLAAKKRTEAEALKAELLDVGFARLTAVRSRLDAIDKKIKETNDQLTKLEVSVKTFTRNYEKAQAKVAQMETELENTKAKLIQVDTNLKELEEEGRLCMETFQRIQSEVEELQKSKKDIEVKLEGLQTDLASMQKAETVAKRKITQLESELSQAVSKARSWQRELRGLRLHRIDEEDESELEAISPRNSLQHTSSQPDSDPQYKPPGDTHRNSTKLPSYTEEELQDLHVDSQEMRGLEERIQSMAPNMAAIEEFRRKAEVYLTRVGELNHVTSVLSDQRKQMEDAKSKRLSEFLDGFHTITARLKEMYQMITQGGDAELELIDSLDPFSEGIVFSVRPPKKSWKNIANLSGGEKTLSSLALVFALHHYKPTPLYVMDEIDAALDFKNVSIVGNYLKDRTKNAQFVVISLRNNMFELADRLVGIYKTHNITKTMILDHGMLTDQLRKMVVRVAMRHGREEDLIESQQQPQQPQQVGRTLSSQSTFSQVPLLPNPQSHTLPDSATDGYDYSHPIVIH